VLPIAAFVVAAPRVVDGLGKEHFGVLMVVVAMTALLSSMDLGLGAGAVRLIARASGERDLIAVSEVVREVFTAFAGLALLVAGAAWFLAGPIATLLFSDTSLAPAEVRHVVRLGGLLAAVGFVGAGASVLARGMEAIPFVSAVQGVYSTAIWLGAWALVTHGYGLTGILLWLLAMSAVGALVFAAWGLYHCPGTSFRPTRRWRHLRGALSFNAFAFASQLNAAAINNLDKLLISLVLGPVAVANYSLVANVAAKLPLVAGAIASFVYPRAAALCIGEGNEAIRMLYVQVSRYLTLILAPLTVVGILLTEHALRLWIGDEFAHDMNRVAVVLFAAFSIATVSVVPSLIFNAMGNSRIGAVFSGIAVLLTAVISLVLIGRWGILGVAVGVLIGMLQGVVYAGLLERSLGLGWFLSRRRFLVQVAICLAAEAIAILLLRDLAAEWTGLIGVALLGCFFFFGAWVLLGFATVDDRALVHRIVSLSWLRKPSR